MDLTRLENYFSTKMRRLKTNRICLVTPTVPSNGSGRHEACQASVQDKGKRRYNWFTDPDREDEEEDDSLVDTTKKIAQEDG